MPEPHSPEVARILLDWAGEAARGVPPTKHTGPPTMPYELGLLRAFQRISKWPRMDWARVWQKAAHDPEWCAAWETAYFLEREARPKKDGDLGRPFHARMASWVRKTTTRRRMRA